MGQIFTIDDNRTMYCKPQMRASGGVWNPVTQAWMFGNAEDHEAGLYELYKATRATPAMRETLSEMLIDGTAVVAWNYDSQTQLLDVDALEYAEAQKLLAAGYAARRVLGVHPLEDREVDRSGDDDELRAVAFDERARASATRGRRRGSPAA